MCSIKVNSKILKNAKLGFYSSTLQVFYNSTSYIYPILIHNPHGDNHLSYSTIISAYGDVSTTILTTAQLSRHLLVSTQPSRLQYNHLNQYIKVGSVFGSPVAHSADSTLVMFCI